MRLKEKVGEACKLRDITVKKLCTLIKMSETNMYACFKRDSIETKHLEKISEALRINPTFWFSDQEGNFFLNNEGNLVNSSSFKGNLTVNKGTQEETARIQAENEQLRKELDMMKQLLAAKDETISALKGK